MNLLSLALILLGAALIVLVVWMFTLQKRISKLLAGKSGVNLEDTINTHTASIDELFRAKSGLKMELGALDERIKKKIQGAKTIRFNPFHGTGSGGNQSFATALLDEKGDGVVLSSLYSREKLSIFAKPIKNRTSEFELTEEEAEVLK